MKKVDNIPLKADVLVINIPGECVMKCPGCYWKHVTHDETRTLGSVESMLDIINRVQADKYVISIPTLSKHQSGKSYADILKITNIVKNKHKELCFMISSKDICDEITPAELYTNYYVSEVCITHHSISCFDINNLSFVRTVEAAITNDIKVSIQLMWWHNHLEGFTRQVRNLLTLCSEHDINLIVSVDMQGNIINDVYLRTSFIRECLDISMSDIDIHPCVLTYADTTGKFGCVAGSGYYEILNGTVYEGCPYNCYNKCQENISV